MEFGGISGRALRFSHLLIFALLLNFGAFPERFRISGVEYELEKTRQPALEREIPVSKEKIFDTREELESYAQDLRTRMLNTRLFDSVEIEISVVEPVETTTDAKNAKNSEVSTSSTSETPVLLKIRAEESRSLLVLPYPKYSSSDGLSVKLKVKDANFLGRMSPLSAEAYLSVEEDEDTGGRRKAAGFSLDYLFPFSIRGLDASWRNTLASEYGIDTGEWEFGAETALGVEFPLGRHALALSASQSAARDLEFEDFGDEFHLNTKARLSLPVRVSEIEGWGEVFWTPFSEFSVTYDKTGVFGISFEDRELTSPKLTFGHEVSAERIDWTGNFRDGLSAAFGQALTYDYRRKEYNPKVYGKAMGFRSFGRFALACRIFATASGSSAERIGKELRGIIDDQRFRESRKRALKVSSAILLNLDAPVKIVETDWNGWADSVFGAESSVSRRTRWAGEYFDFEMQFSPFLDLALSSNEISGRIFSARDGWYSGGLEVLIFPKRWRSVVVRASCGWDLGRKFLKDGIDTTWRRNVTEREIYIGLGLLY